MMRRAKGFTLIELLVVIAVIALLMAILVPTLQRVRRQAKAIACQSNLKQWGTLWATWTSDNDGYFPGCRPDDRPPQDWPRESWPWGGRWGWGPGWGWGWYGGYPYGDSNWYKTTMGLWCCPMATKPVDPRGQRYPAGGTFLAWDTWRRSGPRPPGDWCASYGANRWLWRYYQRHLYNWDEPYPSYSWRTVDVKGTRNIPVMLDSATPSAWLSHPFGSLDPPECDAIPTLTVREETYPNTSCINRHDGYVNGLFMDWSVRKVGLKELWTLKWHRKFNTRNRWTRAGGVKPEDWPQWMRRFKDY